MELYYTTNSIGLIIKKKYVETTNLVTVDLLKKDVKATHLVPSGRPSGNLT